MKHKFTPSKYYYTFGPHTPVLKIKPGDTLLTTTVDADGYDSNGIAIPVEMKQTSPDTEYYPANPLVGPFYIEDAELNDTLVIHIEKIKLNRNSAYSLILPNFGTLTEETPYRQLLLNDPLERIYFPWMLNLKNNTGILKLSKSKVKRMEIPLHPFLGSIGVAPRYGRYETSLTPAEYGGNMDCIETKEGTTLYLPIFVRGAYLFFGDVHAAQGDGELCGVALETTAEVTLNLDLIKGRPLEWPRLENKEYIMVAGSSRPLMDALKIAHVELTKWLVNEYGFDKWEAFQILSQVGSCRVGNVVDPNYTVVAKFPKKYLPKMS